MGPFTDVWGQPIGPILRPQPGRRDHQELALLAARNHPEERSYLLLRGGSLKSQKKTVFFALGVVFPDDGGDRCRNMSSCSFTV